MNERLAKYRRQIESLDRLARDSAATPGEKQAALRLKERLEHMIDPQVARNSALSAPSFYVTDKIYSWNSSMISALFRRLGGFSDVCVLKEIERPGWTFEFDREKRFYLSEFQVIRWTVDELLEAFSGFLKADIMAELPAGNMT